MTERAWPADWAERVAGVNCGMCATIGRGDNDLAIAVADLPYSSVGLERRSRLPGYCVVIWRHGHVAEPIDLSPSDAAGYWQDVLEVANAIRNEFEPMKLNFLTLGNYVPHLHTHVVPRYRDDPAPGGPIAWEQMFFLDPGPEAMLRRQAAALRSRLPH
jgi:diadenosine tetraphosphate (Ap4A) HIT family hydrolase